MTHAQHRFSSFIGAPFLLAALYVLGAATMWERQDPLEGRANLSAANSHLIQDVYPTFHFTASHLKSGVLPAWNPQVVCGTPWLANPNIGLFQPLHIFFYFLPTQEALAAHALTCLALLGLAAGLFIRLQGCGYVSAAFGGTVWAFSGIITGTISRPTTASALVWGTFLFVTLALHARFAERARPKGFSVALMAFCLAMLLLAGDLAVIVVFVLIAAACSLMIRPASIGTGRGWLAYAGGLVAALLLALGMSALQWMPTLLYAQTLTDPLRQLWDLPYPGYFPATLRGFGLQLLANESIPLPRSAYWGILPLVLAPAAFSRRIRHGAREAGVPRQARQIALFFLVVLLVCSAATLAPDASLPWSFPREVLFYPIALGVALTSALGLDRLLAATRTPDAPRLWAPLLLVACAGVALFLIAGARPRGYLIAGALCLLPFLILRARWAAVFTGAGLVALLFVDLYTGSNHIEGHPEHLAPACYLSEADLKSTLEEQTVDGRVLTSAHPMDPVWPQNVGMLFALKTVGGSGIPLSRQQALWWDRLMPRIPQEMALAQEKPLISAVPDYRGGRQAPDLRLLSLMSCRSLILAPGGILLPGSDHPLLAALRELPLSESVWVGVNEHAVDRANMVQRWQEVGSVEEALDVIQQPGFAYRTTAVVDLSEGVGLEPAFSQSAARAQEEFIPYSFVQDEGPNHVRVAVRAAVPGILVLADTYAPGWQATIDENPVSIFRANGIFRGVAVPAGRHEVLFRYRTPGLALGLTLSGVSLVVMLSLLLRGLFGAARHDKS